MRKDVDCEYFPYSVSGNPRNSYFLIKNTGEIEEFGKNKSDWIRNLTLCSLATKGEGKIYATWVGKWKTDLFEIIDINKFTEANKSIAF